MEALKDRPLSKEIRRAKLIKAPTGINEGPGSVAPLQRGEILNIWQTINLFHQDRIEVLVLQDEVGATETMSEALREIRKRVGREDVVKCKPFQSEEDLEKYLPKTEDDDHVKRIVLVTGERSKSMVSNLVSNSPELFKKVRALGITLPDGYSGLKPREKTFYQASMLMRGICARLYESDENNPWIGIFFRDILKGCYDGDTDTLLKGLPEAENETSDVTIKRIGNCSNSSIRLLSELVADAIEHLKLIMKEFWTAA
jgi:hypothetical protein